MTSTTTTRDATVADIVRRLTTPYLATAESALAWGMGDVSSRSITRALDEAIEAGVVEVVEVRDTTYGRGVRFVRLTPKPPRTSLTHIVNRLWQLRDSYDSAYQRESAWDGGEHSGPAMSAAYERAVRDALSAYGWTAVALEEELTARTTERWAYFSGVLSGDFTARCVECGTRQDVLSSRHTGGSDPSTLLQLACGHVAL